MEQNQNNQESNNNKDLFNDDAALGAFLMGNNTPPASEPPTPEPAATEPQAEPAKVEITDDLFNEWLSKKTEGKFSKLEDIEIAELPEGSKDLYTLLKEGKTDEVYDYIVKSKIDYSKFDNTDLLREKISRENPALSKEEVEDILIHDYKIGSELTEDEKENLTPRELAAYEAEVKRASLRAKQDAEAMRKQLEAEKKELSLPEIKKIYVAQPVDNSKEEAEKLAQAFEAWKAEIDAELPKVKELTFEVEVGEAKDTFSSTFKLDDKQEAAVRKALEVGIEPGDENLPFKDIVEKATFKLFGKQIVAAAIKDAVAKAKEQFVEKELKQVDLSPRGNRTANATEGKNWAQHMMDQ